MTIELENLTLPQMLRRRAQLQPQRVAIRQKDFGIWNPLSWEDYYRRASHIGLGLCALGVEPGGHIGVLSENRVEWVLAQMGAGLVGAVTVGVYATSPTNEVAYVLEHADVDVVICEDQEQTDKVLAVLDRLPRLKKVVVMEEKGLRNTPAEFRERVLPFSQLEVLGVEYEAVHRGRIDEVLTRQSLADIGLMIYTSGSTGKPKGAMISYANILGVAPGIIERLGLNADSRHLSYLPLCHVAEQMLTMFTPIYLGSQVNFGESLRTVQEDLREVAPTLFLGVPRIWEKLHAAISIRIHETGAWRRRLFERAVAACAPFANKAASQRSFAERWRYGLYYWLILRSMQNFIGLRKAGVALTGAAPISPAIIAFFRCLGVPLVEVYGLTESTGMVFGQRPDHVQPGTVGAAIAGVEYRIAASGELQIRGDAVFAGYYKSPEATAAAVQDDWLHTGDVVVEVDGDIRIVDRLKDIMITAGGKNLTPSEIENTMKASPYIKECIVVADGRNFVSALIQIDSETVGKWAERQRLAFTHFRSLVDSPAVRELVAAEIAKGNASLAQVAQVRKFHLLTKELDHDDGEVTATMKIRRSSIYQTYAREIEAMYGHG